MQVDRILVHLRGGLGNQLFQYGTGLALARTHNAKLFIDTSLLPIGNTTIRGVSHWPEQISAFASEATFTRSNKSRLMTFFESRLLQAERAVGDGSHGALTGRNVYANENFPNVEGLSKLRGRSIRINSYCASPPHFLGYDEEIKRQIKEIKSPSEEYHYAAGLASKDAPIGVHIRLGDYTNFPKVYGIFDSKYFWNSVEYALRTLGDRPVWVFSDQPELVKSLAPEIARLNRAPVELASLSGLETINLMAQTQGLVCSNSTFSWWAAYLGSRPDFQAIFPAPLFAASGPPEPKAFIQPGWIQLGRDFNA